MNRKKGLYELIFKRLIDFIMSLLGLILLFPLFIVLSVLVLIKHGSPVLFKQKRPGKNEKIFTMYKFRTMTNEKDSDGNLLPDEKRLTKFGKFLRSTSLDELPELWNILIGKMSIVGPRPLLVEYLDRYTEIQKQRHLVRPGLTGLAQANGRNSLTWEDKFALDVEYVHKITFINDLKIIFKTIKIILGRKGISSETSATMEMFERNIKKEK